MKAYEFSTQLTSEGNLKFPEALMKNLPINQEVRVIILVDESVETEAQENTDWSRLGAEQFFSDYRDADAIYNTI